MFSKSLRKVLSITVVLALCISSLIGCSKKEKESPAASDVEVTNAADSSNSSSETKPEHVKFTVFIAENEPEITFTESWAGKKILEDLNVELDIQYGGSESKTLQGVMLASGKYPDLLVLNNDDNSGMPAYIAAKAVIPITQYITADTNLYKWEGADFVEAMKYPDGEIYCYNSRVGWDNFTDSGAGFWIQAAVLKDAGWPKVKTIDQYWSILENYYAKNPEINGAKTICFSFQSDGWKLDSLTNPALLASGYQDNGGFVCEDNGDGTIAASFIHGSEEEYRYLKLLNEKYNKGLVDGDGFIDKYDEWAAKMSSGRVLGYYGWTYERGSINAALKNSGMPEREFVYLPLSFDERTQLQYRTTTPITYTARQGICISSTCKDPERAIQFLDGIATKENNDILQWGEEGVDYSVDENGKRFLTDEQVKQASNKEYVQQRGIYGSGQAGFVHCTFGNLSFPDKQNRNYEDGNPTGGNLTEEYLKAKYNPAVKEYLDAYGYITLGDAFNEPVIAPYGMAYTVAIPSDSDISLTVTMILERVRSYMAKLLLAKDGEFDSIWENFKQDLKDAGVDDYNQHITDALNLRIKEGRTNE